MKRLMIIPTLAAVALIVAAIVMHRSSTKLSAGTAAMPSLQELHTAASANNLPTQDFEDMSLANPSVTKRPPAD
ncbi:MAG TPA: hypothetical protein VK620_05725 [Bradyrhizobium sp.]|nr:hypothetical protein [Bradyrhizobium sp.]